MKLESIYQEIILEHSKNPLNAILKEPFTKEVKHYNPLCGDEIILRVYKENNIISDLSYKVSGCAICSASSSIMSGLIKLLTVDEFYIKYNIFIKLMHSGAKFESVLDDREIEEIGDVYIFGSVAQYPMRIKCALLPWMALKDSIEQ